MSGGNLSDFFNVTMLAFVWCEAFRITLTAAVVYTAEARKASR